MIAEPTAAPASSSALNSILPVVTLILGWFLNSVSERFQHRRLRRDQIAERRDDFQRQTLLEVQKAMLDLVQASLSGEDAEKRFSTQMRIAVLCARVRDASALELIEKFRNASTQMEKASNEEFPSCVDVMHSSFAQAQKRIGELLLSFDAPGK